MYADKIKQGSVSIVKDDSEESSSIFSQSDQSQKSQVGELQSVYDRLQKERLQRRQSEQEAYRLKRLESAMADDGDATWSLLGVHKKKLEPMLRVPSY